jgi:TPR repeat protein
MSERESDLDELRRFHGMLKTDPQAGLDGLKALAEQGSSMSMIYIVEAYARGEVVPRDIAQAEEWNRRAMAAGYVHGSYELGRYYYSAKDYERARNAFVQGTRLGFAPSQNMLALMDLRGFGGPKDLQSARDLLEKAVQQGHVYAKRTLAWLLIRGTYGFWGAISRAVSAFIWGDRPLEFDR